MIERDGVIEAVMDAWMLQQMTWRSDDLALLTCEAA
jgi:hypothetical protein